MFVTYLLIRLITFPFAFLPYPAIHWIGERLGSLAYFLIPKYRKRAQSNLALARVSDNNATIRKLARKSLQNLAITCLEYPKLAREKEIGNIVTSLNPEKAQALMQTGRGAIFFCGHQANWELLFLEGTSKMSGVAIGRPINNRHLYKWIQSIRQKFGGKIIQPKNAIKEGLRALKRGSFLGIVGDQGMPDSGFCSPFFGRPAYTSPLPALLAYKTDVPIIVTSTYREKGHYYIHYSEPLYPNSQAPLENEVRRLMEALLSLHEASIRERPDQWMWIHNRWKQQTLATIKRPFRQDSIALFLPDDPTLIQQLPRLRTLFPTEQITLFIPKQLTPAIDAEIHPYESLHETLIDDLRFKLIVNFTGQRAINAHYKKTAATLISPPTFEAFERAITHG